MPDTNVTTLRKSTKPRNRNRDEIPDDAEGVRFVQFLRMAQIGETKGKELIRTGRVKSIKLGRTRIISVRSIRELINGEAA